MRLDADAGFEALLHPVGTRRFFEEIYERRPLRISRKDTRHYAEIFDLSDLDALLGSPATASKFLRLHQAGTEIPPRRWSRGSEVDANKVCSLFASGATIIVNGASRFFPRLATYCNDVERQMRFGVQPNIYVTPPGSRGFDRHYDDHDVFILQVLGRKRWRLYGSPVELPCRNQKHEWGKYLSMPLKESFSLETGDLLYIPRGHLHDAETSDEASIHITFGLHPPCLFEIVDEIARQARDSPAFRRTVPGIAMELPAGEFESSVKGWLHALVDEADIGTLLGAMDKRFVSWRNPGRQVRFRELLCLPYLDESARVSPVRSIVYRLEREDGQIQLCLPNTILKFPIFMEETLRCLLQSQSLTIADMPGLLDADGRIALAAQLVAAGVLRLDPMLATARVDRTVA